MKIVIPGGSGHVGTLLARALASRGDDVVVLSRAPRSAPWRVAHWDGRTVGEWSEEIDGADVVINLAGRSVNCRYTPAHRAEIMDSRVESTRAVGTAIANSRTPPRVWLQASTATIYAHRYDAPNDEASGVIGGGSEPSVPDTWRFSIDVARAWEATLDEADVPRTRKVALRSAIIMSPEDGGPFATLMELVGRGLGGRSGDGLQYVSWIHDSDFVRAVLWIIAHDGLAGVVNVSSPNPLPQEDFMRTLRRAAGVRVALPAMKWMLEVGAMVMGTETELILKSRRVVPARLVEGGFAFTYPEWPGAALDLVRRRRSGGQR